MMDTPHPGGAMASPRRCESVAVAPGLGQHSAASWGSSVVSGPSAGPWSHRTAAMGEHGLCMTNKQTTNQAANQATCSWGLLGSPLGFPSRYIAPFERIRKDQLIQLVVYPLSEAKLSVGKPSQKLRAWKGGKCNV